jgi:hypothetical protein
MTSIAYPSQACPTPGPAPSGFGGGGRPGTAAAAVWWGHGMATRTKHFGRGEFIQLDDLRLVQLEELRSVKARRRVPQD